MALNWSENFRRFVISEFLHHVGIHLNRLSDFAGPLQFSMRSAVENVFEVIGVLIFCLCVLSITSDYEGRSLISMFGFFAILYSSYFTFR